MEGYILRVCVVSRLCVYHLIFDYMLISVFEFAIHENLHAVLQNKCNILGGMCLY